MIKALSIDQFRLIHSARLEFHAGMNVITGETGSGKSIMLRALALVTGARADKDDVRKGSSKCVIELELDLPNSLEPWFLSRDLDFYPELRGLSIHFSRRRQRKNYSNAYKHQMCHKEKEQPIEPPRET